MALDHRTFQERKVFPDMRFIDEQQDFRNAPIRGQISPTRSSTKLMRQISGLGMEDPIFCTTEDVPEHPSNIFADMGLDDVPSDMVDLMSVASDPTATCGDGLDETLLQLNHICFIQTSASLLNDSSFQKTQGQDDRRKTFEVPPQLLEDNSNSSRSPRGFSILRDNCAPMPHSKRKLGIIHSQSAAHRIRANRNNPLNSSRMIDELFVSSEHNGSKKLEHQKKDPWNASIPSLDVNGVFSCSNHSSKMDSKADYSSNCAMHDPLLVEAALALQKQQSGRSNRIIKMTSYQNVIDEGCPDKKAAAVHSSTPKERRVLPTLSGIFSS
jgi:hypothetical protein